MMARRTAAARYDQQNELCARLILADVAKYGGRDSLMVRWAVLVMAKVAPKDWQCAPLQSGAAKPSLAVDVGISA